MVNFGIRLKALRTERHLTQKQLGEMVGLRGSIISFYEVGDRMPSPEVIIKFASVFHVTTDFLMGVERSRSISTEGLDEASVSAISHMVELLREKKS